MNVVFVIDMKYTDAAKSISRAQAYNAALEMDFCVYSILDLVLGTLCMPRDYVDEFIDATQDADLETAFANLLDYFYCALDAILDDQASDIAIRNTPQFNKDQEFHSKIHASDDTYLNESVSNTYLISTAFAEHVIQTLRSNLPDDLFYLKGYTITDAKKFQFGGPYYVTAEIEILRKSVPRFRPVRDYLRLSKLSAL